MATQPTLGYPGFRKSYNVAEAIVAGSGLNAGLVVEQRTGTDLVGLAADASVKVRGVAMDDIPAARTSITGKQVGDDHPLAVFSGGDINVVCSLAVTEGVLICAAASGQVRPWISGTDAPGSSIGRANAAASGGAVVNCYIKGGG